MRRTPVIKIHGFALLLMALAWLTATSCACTTCLAQFYPVPLYPPFGYPHPRQPPVEPKDAPIEIGGYAMLGGAIEEAPPPHTRNFVSAAGIYAQWNRYGLSPGPDLRLQGSRSDLYGLLIGPRVAYQPRGRLRPFRPYLEGLFGKNELSHVATSASFSTEYTGVTRSIAIGLDLQTGAGFDWRVIEFCKGSFTGLHGSYPQTVMTGVLVHLP